MPWKETWTMDERLMFIGECLRGELPMTALCERYGISRKTGYKWLARYQDDPESGLLERSRAPHRCANGLAGAVAAPILALRRRHPHYGPRKLLAHLERLHPGQRWPAASTIGDLLRREGLSAPRRRRARGVPVTQPFSTVAAPNDVWCADFKGWFRTADGVRCDPLTISDAHSRFLLDCRIVAPTREGVEPRFIRAFREFGLPRALRTDNGPPFASTGAGGLSRLSVTWVKLGIRLERIDPGAPQQNGRHERRHRTLKEQTSQPPAATPKAQQRRFDDFRRHYNCERPHEALDQTTPASHYTASPRCYPERIEEPWYDADHAVRRVRNSGEIKWGGELIFVSEALLGEPVGIAETEDGDWIVRFADIGLGVINRQTKKLRRFAAPRPGRRKAQHTGNTVTHVSGP
ncbi:MAG TPA: IS481 family transposase [Stellaceae bacterium]|nr:IS481 family transposase [Stellaceae bacterium]